ncbi:conserved hypothetical protein [Pediculus humanus corporis]|uniref:Intraflagellar transport protein 122 homolog n=1 Tax=Pediculus humanus subsp. corporis TaxID=121224 RepID=E0VXI8_PEDHC|nr:uncharacterized protein Phum_PHUM501010 [Pediculus humanus corporis]EEB18094.1 conserved hypothetical protein [Pediculus humanus corporis]
MRTLCKWELQHDHCVYDLCFNPEGTQLIAAIGLKVYAYDVVEGVLLQALRGHKDNVYCVCYAKDGKKFASGSADKTVIIWTSKLEGILKYTHNDAIQCLAYNPVTLVLASCAVSDFGFWAGDQKSVQKHKSHARITSCSWTKDGLYLALGLANGSVSIRNKSGEEKGRIDRPGGLQTPIWSLSWSPVREDGHDVLCVADWGQYLSFYTLGGKLIEKEFILGFDPLRVSYLNSGDYVLVAGTGKTCNLHTKEGVKLGTIGPIRKSWIWCCAANPDNDFVALGTQDGSLAYYQLSFNVVHGLYKERYAYRESMTDVIIQHLITDQKVRIKCRDLIKKVAIYKDRLAVQLPERIVIYELASTDSTGMHYKVREKVNLKLQCNLLVVCSEHVILCQDKRLQCLTLSGENVREWIMDSTIRYIKVVGGPPGSEGMLLGLKNGEVKKIFVDNAFPIDLIKVPHPIKCLDLSKSRMKLAAVEDTNQVHVYDLETKELIYQEPNATSAAWNSYFEDILCFSCNDVLSIKVSNFPINHQKLSGVAVGFSGSKLFCLNDSTMTTIEVPLSAPLFQYMEKKMFSEAYQVACLGVPEEDWENLANAALDNFEFEIAKLAFIRVKNLKYLNLIHDFQERQKKSDKNKELFLADICAFRGKYREAAKLYQKAGHEQKALNMFTDLRMFDVAQEYLGSGDNINRKSLLRKKAEWAKNINEPRAAAEMYLSAGDTMNAIEIIAENGWVDTLLDVGRKLDKADREGIELVARHLQRLGALNFSTEMYRKLGEEKSVVLLHVEAKDWKEAFALAERHPEFKDLVYAPYARWLAENDRFVEAQKAFHQAGKLDEAFDVLQKLTDNAVNEGRFQDAGYYYWVLAQQYLESANDKEGEDRDILIDNYFKSERLASIYYTYDNIQKYIDEPFTPYMPEALFNIAMYLTHEIKEKRPPGVSQFAILYALSKQACSLGAFKLARQVLDKIQTLKVPLRFQEYIDVSTILVRAKPYHDNDEMLPMCYRCSSYNPLSCTTGSNSCTNCRQPFVYSFFSFEILPLVEFVLEDGITDEEAVKLIETPPSYGSESKDNKENGWIQTEGESYQMLHFEENSSTVDPFTAKLVNFDIEKDGFTPVTVNRSTLKSLDPNEVLISQRPKPLRYRYYRNIIPDLPIVICHSCHKAFHMDDYELQVLQKGHCPFCRTPSLDSPMKDVNEDEMIRTYSL